MPWLNTLSLCFLSQPAQHGSDPNLGVSQRNTALQKGIYHATCILVFAHRLLLHRSNLPNIIRPRAFNFLANVRPLKEANKKLIKTLASQTLERIGFARSERQRCICMRMADVLMPHMCCPIHVCATCSPSSQERGFYERAPSG